MHEGDILYYQCDQCGGDMESPRDKVGTMETCPSCNRRMKVEDFPFVAEHERKTHEACDNAPTHEFLSTVTEATQDGRTCFLNTCQELEPVYLAREPENPYDNNAIAVYVIRTSSHGNNIYRKAGYITSDERSAVSSLMDKGYRTVGFVQRAYVEKEGESVSLEIAVAVHEQ